MAAYDGSCLIRRVGINEAGITMLDLQDTKNAFSWRWFLAKKESNRETLAIALAAMTSNKNIEIIVNDTKEYTEIQRIFFLAQG